MKIFERLTKKEKNEVSSQPEEVARFRVDGKEYLVDFTDIDRSLFIPTDNPGSEPENLTRIALPDGSQIVALFSTTAIYPILTFQRFANEDDMTRIKNLYIAQIDSKQ